jgi:hypothetical protein
LVILLPIATCVSRLLRLGDAVEGKHCSAVKLLSVGGCR